MHSKGLGLYVTAILGCLLLARVVIEKDTRRLGTRLLIMTTFAALSGAGWYLKNWHVYGNPVYPFQVALPGMDIILFSGKNLEMLVEPSGSGNYRDSSLLWVYLSQFAGISYQPGWGSHFFPWLASYGRYDFSQSKSYMAGAFYYSVLRSNSFLLRISLLLGPMFGWVGCIWLYVTGNS